MKNLTKLMFAMALTSTVLTSCKDKDVYDPSYKQAELAESFANNVSNEIDPNQTWCNVQSITASVYVGYSGSFTINFYDADPLDVSSSDTITKYATATIEGGTTTDVTFSGPSMSTVYAVLYDEANMGISAVATVTDNKCSFNFGGSATRAASKKMSLANKTRTASSGGWEYSDTATFTEDVISSIVSALPEGVNAANKKNNYELKSTGEFTIYPVYGVTSGNDAVGYYYYNPSDSANTYQEVTLIENIKDMGDNALVKTVQSEWYTSSSNYQYGASWINSDFVGKSTLTVKGYSINVPVGWNVGFWIKNPNYANVEGYKEFYSNKSKNPNGEYYSAVATDVDGYTFFGLEDWANNYGSSDMDSNDIVFAMTGSTPTVPDIITPGEEEEKKEVEGQYVTVAFEDLGSIGDFDFNDVVLYIQHVDGESTATVKWMAAGGVLPVTVYFNGSQIFNKKTSSEMINTSSWSGSKIDDDVTIDVSGYDMSTTSFYDLFSIGVEQASGESESTSTVIESSGYTGKAPCAIIVACAWKWPKEKVNIVSAYSNFSNYAKSATETSWSDTYVSSKVITPSNY